MTMNNIRMWTCPQCGRTNSGRFCVICGAKRPEEAEKPAAAVNEKEPFEIPELDAMIGDTVEKTVDEAIEQEEAAREEIKKDSKEEVKEELTEAAALPADEASGSESREHYEVPENAVSSGIEEKANAAESAAENDKGTKEVYEVPEVMVPSHAAENELNARREKEKQEKERLEKERLEKERQEAIKANTAPAPKPEPVKPAYQKPKPIYPKAAREKKSHPVLTALLSGLIGLGAGFGGGYLAVKKYAKEPAVIYQTAPAAAESQPASSEAKPENAEVTTVQTMPAGKTLQEVAETASKTVVEIQVENTTTTYGFFGGTYTSTAAGSGVIISEDGYIITNNHVIEGGRNIKVKTYNGEEFDAKIVGSDVKSDIGVIKINAGGLNAAVIGDSDLLRVGDTAIVIGNPLGTLGGTVTNGIISAINREITLNNQSMNLIQTNAAINSGNSGGGLFDGDGNLVGIVNAKDSGMTSSGSLIEGLGFAIPINTAMSVANDLMANGYVKDRPTIGIGLQTLDEDYMNYKAGLYIATVYEGGAAEAAGLQEGDRILKADGKDIKTYTELTRVLTGKKVGDEMTMVVDREGQEVEVTLTLTGTLASMQETRN